VSPVVLSALTHFISNWKSTVSGILTVTLVSSAALMKYPPVMQHLKLMAFLGGFQVLGKIWIALITTDVKKEQ